MLRYSWSTGDQEEGWVVKVSGGGKLSAAQERAVELLVVEDGPLRVSDIGARRTVDVLVRDGWAEELVQFGGISYVATQSARDWYRQQQVTELPTEPARYRVGDRLHFTPSPERAPFGSVIGEGDVELVEVVDHGSATRWSSRHTYVVRALDGSGTQGAADYELTEIESELAVATCAHRLSGSHTVVRVAGREAGTCAECCEGIERVSGGAWVVQVPLRPDLADAEPEELAEAGGVTERDAVMALGGSPWTHPKTGVERIYLNDWAAIIGLEYSLYGTGNISSASLDGVGISNGRATGILARGRTRVYWGAGRITVQESAEPALITDRVRAAIDAKLAELSPPVVTEGDERDEREWFDDEAGEIVDIPTMERLIADGTVALVSRESETVICVQWPTCGVQRFVLRHDVPVIPVLAESPLADLAGLTVVDVSWTETEEEPEGAVSPRARFEGLPVARPEPITAVDVALLDASPATVATMQPRYYNKYKIRKGGRVKGWRR